MNLCGDALSDINEAIFAIFYIFINKYASVNEEEKGYIQTKRQHAPLLDFDPTR